MLNQIFARKCLDLQLLNIGYYLLGHTICISNQYTPNQSLYTIEKALYVIVGNCNRHIEYPLTILREPTDITVVSVYESSLTIKIFKTKTKHQGRQAPSTSMFHRKRNCNHIKITTQAFFFSFLLLKDCFVRNQKVESDYSLSFGTLTVFVAVFYNQCFALGLSEITAQLSMFLLTRLSFTLQSTACKYQLFSLASFNYFSYFE